VNESPVDTSRETYKANLGIVLRAIFPDVSYQEERLLRVAEVLLYVKPIILFVQVYRKCGDQILDHEGTGARGMEYIKAILRTRYLRFCRLAEIES